MPQDSHAYHSWIKIKAVIDIIPFKNHSLCSQGKIMRNTFILTNIVDKIMWTVIESLSTPYFAQSVILLDSRVSIGVVMHVSCRDHSLLSHWVFSGGN